MAYRLPDSGVFDDAVGGAAAWKKPLTRCREIQGYEIVVSEGLDTLDRCFLRKHRTTQRESGKFSDDPRGPEENRMGSKRNTGKTGRSSGKSGEAEGKSGVFYNTGKRGELLCT